MENRQCNQLRITKKPWFDPS